MTIKTVNIDAIKYQLRSVIKIVSCKNLKQLGKHILAVEVNFALLIKESWVPAKEPYHA